MFHVEILVVLAPAILSSVLCVVANTGALRRLYAALVVGPARAVSQSSAHLNTLINVSVGITLAGPLVSVLYGPNSAPLWEPLPLVLTIVFGATTVRLSKMAAQLERAQAAAQEETLRAARQALASPPSARRTRRRRHRRNR